MITECVVVRIHDGDQIGAEQAGSDEVAADARMHVVWTRPSGQNQAVNDDTSVATRLISQTDVPAARHYLGLARYYDGDANGAREMLRSIPPRRPARRPRTASLASVEAATGMRDEAQARIVDIMRGSDWTTTLPTASAPHWRSSVT